MPAVTSPIPDTTAASVRTVANPTTQKIITPVIIPKIANLIMISAKTSAQPNKMV